MFFIKKRFKIKTIIVAILIVLIVIIFYDNKHLQITHYTYISDKITSDLEGLRIVQISDLHNTAFGKDNKRLIQKITELKPDIIVITGDIIDSNHTKLDRAIDFGKKVTDICPVYYVTGNHEYWISDYDRKELIEGLTKAGVKVINNEQVSISIGKTSFSLIGLDDRNLNDATLFNIVDDNKETFSILLAHEPQYLAEYALANVDLVLSGHAHGGQFRIPFVGGVVAPDQGFFPQYTEGEHTKGNTKMIISRGLGNSVIPVRIFNRPEIVCVDLCKE